MAETKESKVSAIDEYSAIRAMLDSKGWELMQSRISEEGDALLSKILDPETSKDKRELAVVELAALSRWPNTIERFKIDAENERLAKEVAARSSVGKQG